MGFAYVRTDNSGTSTFGGTTDVYDLNAGLNYKVNRHLSLRANYAYTNWESSTGFGNYDRNRATLSADYDF